MTEQEMYRYTLIQQVNAKTLKQNKAAEILGISTRQFRKLQDRVRKEGAKGITSRHRKTKGNHQRSIEMKNSTLALIRERYENCGPTFIKEKLNEWHNIDISDETIRLWMIDACIWVPKISRKAIHLPRLRRDCFGELIQGDGSPHHWFGEDLPAATAIVLIDDATSTLTAVHFSEQETTDSYFIALEQHMTKYGIPLALYTDKYSVFKTSKGNGKTQMQRALEELNVQLILANSPQAKGRVERVNRTLQDRLMQEFRLRGIKTIAQANAFMPEYIKMHNQKFSKKPKSSFDAHRSLEGYNLERILVHCEARTLSSSGTFQYINKFFVVQNILEIRRLKGKKVKVYHLRNGMLKVFLGAKEIQVKLLEECRALPELSRKEVLVYRTREHRFQPKSHPWKKYGYQIARSKELKRRAVL